MATNSDGSPAKVGFSFYGNLERVHGKPSLTQAEALLRGGFRTPTGNSPMIAAKR